MGTNALDEKITNICFLLKKNQLSFDSNFSKNVIYLDFSPNDPNKSREMKKLYTVYLYSILGIKPKPKTQTQIFLGVNV